MIPKPIKPKPLPSYNPNKTGSLANKAAVGARVYQGTQPSPQYGKGGLNPGGFSIRDNKAKVKRNLLENQIKKLGGK